jgi:type I restriction enzyme, S subunit
MKQDWEIKSLGELAEIKGGKRVPKGYRLEIEPTNYPYIRVTDFNDNGSVDLNDIHYINEEVFKQIKNYIISTNDLYISIAGTIGKTGIIPKELDGANLTENACKLVFRTDVEPKFVYYFTKTDDFLKQAGLNTRTAAMPKLALTRLSTISFLFPKSLSEQQRIVSILDEAFSAIAKAKANAERNQQNAKELFESYLQNVFTTKGEGWEEKTLGEVLLKTETVDPTKKPNEEFIYLDVSSVNKETKEIENATSLMGKDAPSRARKLIRTNDVIFATVRPTHSRVALIPEEYNEQVCSTGYFVLRSKEFLNNNLVFYFLLTHGFNKQMEKLQKGASYPAVTDNEVKSIIIPFPKSIKEQQIIVQKLDALSVETKKLEAIYQQKINNLEELKKSILNKAFSGELK